MIVAIVKQLAGIVPIEEFREAVDEATAVVDFCFAYTPHLDPNDYLGYDSGWSSYQPPNPGYRWAYDFGNPGLVQQALTPTYDLRGSNKVVDQTAVLVGVAFSELGGLVAAPGLLTPDVTKIVMRVVGLCRTTGVGAQLQLQENGNPLSPAVPLPDTVGVWTTFAFNTNTPPSANLNVYTLQGLLGAAVLAEVRYVSVNLLVDKA